MIVVQVSHLNIDQNCSWGLREDVGEDGEAAALLALAQAVNGRLGARSLPVMLVDANFNCLEAARLKYTAVVTLDAGGPAVGVGHPEVDGAADLSAQLAEDLAAALARSTGAGVSRTAPGSTDHYLFQVLHQETPWALVQVGSLELLSERQDEVAQSVTEGLLAFLGLPAVEPEPEWKRNLEPHTVTVVLNRSVRKIDLGTGIAESTTLQGLLQALYLTRLGDRWFYVPRETVEGTAVPPIGYLKSEVDSAAGASLAPPPPSPPAASAPPPPVAPPTPQPAAEAPAAPPAGQDASAWERRLEELILGLQAQFGDVLDHLRAGRG